MSIGKNKSKNQSTQSSTSQSNAWLDPQIMANLQAGLEGTKAFANKPFEAFTGERVAGFNDTQIQAQDMLKGIGTGTSALLSDAATAAKSVASFQPGKVAATGYTAAKAAPTLLKDADLSAYMNPYEDQVVGGVSADIERARQIQRKNDLQKAQASGAFGSDRHGVMDSLTNEASLRTLANTVSGLRQTGYNNAMGFAGADADRSNTAAFSNQAAENAALQFSAGQGLTADLANQDAAAKAAAINATGSQLLSGLSDQSLQDQITRAGLVSSVGDTQQQQAQAVNDASLASYKEQQNYELLMEELKQKALALFGNPTLSSSTSSSTGQSSGKSSGFNLGIPLPV